MFGADRLLDGWRRGWPWAWSAVLTLLLLGPALGRGFLLRYDMVWVPDLPLRADVLGLGSALPRAVPSDAVIGLVDELVPGELLQKLVLFGALLLAGAGAAALLAGQGRFAQAVATSAYLWNPFVVERLLIGHWPILIGYAVLPWLVVSVRRWRSSGTFPWQLLALAPLGSLSIGAGLVTAVVLVASVLALGPQRVRRSLISSALLVAANAPWLVAGVLHGAGARSDALGAEVFALRGEGPLPAPLTALTLGGIWNSEVVLTSRTGVLALLGLLALGALALAGLYRLWQQRDDVERRGEWVALGVSWLLGWGLACFTWAAPGAVGWLAEQVPGAGVLRDGSRFLALCAPAAVVLVAQGSALLRESIARLGAGAMTNVANGVLLALLPLALLPDAAWGMGGRLEPVAYPDVYADVVGVVGDADGGLVVVLPFSNYRAPEWNNQTKVLDPISRMFTARPVHSDELVVSGIRVSGEDRLGRAVVDALAQPSPSERSRALAANGVSRVTVEAGVPGALAEIEGERLFDRDGWQVIEIAEPAPVAAASTARVTAMTLAWGLFAALWLAAGWKLLSPWLRRARR